MKYYGALEAGGTKMVLAVMDEIGNMVRQESIPTKTPAETMPPAKLTVKPGKAPFSQLMPFPAWV